MNILVVASHPDDEVLGCGGTIAYHLAQGDMVHVVILAEGITARDQSRNRDAHVHELSQLVQAAERAHKILGTTTLELLDLPDNRLDSLDRLDIVKQIEQFIIKYQPTVVYTHHTSDVNVDHRRTHEAVVTACRPQPGFCVTRLLFFEVASSTEWQPAQSGHFFMPNWFVNITATLSLKLQALDAYASEMRSFPHPRSLKALEHLARWRGACVGVDAAEAFVVGREIIGKH